MGSDSLAIGQCAEFGIFLTAGCRCFLHQLCVEIRTTFHHLSIVLVAFGKGIEDIDLPVMFPISHPVIVEILDRIQIVVSDQQMSRNSLVIDCA
jgi:hypothetical protein